jgi:hypothetical protein
MRPIGSRATTYGLPRYSLSRASCGGTSCKTPGRSRVTTPRATSLWTKVRADVSFRPVMFWASARMAAFSNSCPAQAAASMTAPWVPRPGIRGDGQAAAEDRVVSCTQPACLHASRGQLPLIAFPPSRLVRRNPKHVALPSNAPIRSGGGRPTRLLTQSACPGRTGAPKARCVLRQIHHSLGRYRSRFQ